MSTTSPESRSAAKAVLIAMVYALASCGSQDDAKEALRTTSVATAIATAGSLSEVVVAYGVVAASPTHTRLIVMPHEGAIASLDVRDGDVVRKDQALAVIAIAPAAAAQFAQARSALEFATADFARVERLYADRLATNDQLGLARKVLLDAQAAIAQQTSIGANKAQDTLVAPFDGVVSGVTVMPGDQPAVGSAIATVSGRSDTVVQLALEPADAARLQTGAPVQLTPSQGGDEIVGTLAVIGAAVDPTSHLVRATVHLIPNDSARVPLGTTLVAHAELPAVDGIVVPRAALLEDAEGVYVFTLVDGKAQRVSVEVAAETDASALISSGLDAGAKLIVSGNATLEEGVAVSEAVQ